MKKLYPVAFFVFCILVIAVGCGHEPTEATPETQVHITGNPELDKLSEQIAQDPENMDLRYARAQAYYKLEGYDQAILDLKAVMSKDSSKAEYFHLLADVYLDNYNSRSALKVMQVAHKRFPKRIPTILKLAEFQLIFKNYERSLRLANDVLKINPQEPEGYMMLGLNLRELGDTAKAINSFQTVTELDPELIDARILLANLFSDIGNPIAERHFNSAIAISPDNLETLSARGTYYLKNNLLSKAKKDFEAIVKKDRQHSNSFFNLGLIFMEQDSVQKAHDMFNITIETNPLYLKAYFYRGVTYELLGNPTKAYADYIQVNRHDPDYRDVAERVARLKPAG